MWSLIPIIPLFYVFWTTALTVPITGGQIQNIQTINQLHVRMLDPRYNNTVLKLLPPLTAIRPQVPYLWQVREMQNQFIKFTHYGKELPENDAYEFMAQFQHDINYLIRTKGKNVKMPSHQTVSSQQYALYLTMREVNLPAAQVLTWVHGIMQFMNHYDYVEADMQFLTWVSGKGDRLDGRATFVAIASDQA